jgi:nucleotide sugar dehydrogenase
MNDKIGIIGHGYVGEAIAQSVISNLVVRDPAKGFNSTIEEIKDCDAVFVCVPSPSNTDGSCDSSILESVLLNDLKDYKNLIISKVTAPPSVYENLQSQIPNLVYIPEFLTSANAQQDYLNCNFCILGGNIQAYIREAKRIIETTKLGYNIKFYHVSIGEAALIKYIVNSFLATKVVFMNEMHKLCEAHDYNWESIIKGLTLEKRVGESHMQVPGPDGLFGFGGACFPKDTEALIKYAEQFNVNLNILEVALKKNTFLRLTGPK